MSPIQPGLFLRGLSGLHTSGSSLVLGSLWPVALLSQWYGHILLLAGRERRLRPGLLRSLSSPSLLSVAPFLPSQRVRMATSGLPRTLETRSGGSRPLERSASSPLLQRSMTTRMASRKVRMATSGSLRVIALMALGATRLVARSLRSSFRRLETLRATSQWVRMAPLVHRFPHR
jgi:hypothetical protein